MFGLFKKNWPDAVPEKLYRAVVAKSRQPVFYTDFGVPDTVDGRFDMIVLHLVLLFRRLPDEGKLGGELGEDVFKAFVKDMDRSFREMGVGDLGMKRRMTRAAESFYGRAGAYTKALEGPDPAAFAEAIDRNFFPDQSRPDKAAALAAYARETGEALRHVSTRELFTGDLGLGEAVPTVGAAA